MLDTAAERLHHRSLSGAAAFTSAFFILVREGLEALLVVAALAAFLVKTEHRNNMRYLHFGWIGALAVGFLTWLASVSLIEISGASREITEGVAALLATAVLFYVGFWLHDKTNAAQWKQFIETNVRRALSAGTLWGLAGLSFIAVYREVFETILFYQALWVQTDAAGKSMALSGFGVGIGVLAVLAWVIMRYSARLPLRQFFSVTGILMFVLALVFAGKGVAALQEAGYIPVSPVNFPRVDLLGIYPNLQGLLLQLGLLLLALFLWYGLPGKRRAMA
jgi:high-affinity iron transporter